MDRRGFLSSLGAALTSGSVSASGHASAEAEPPLTPQVKLRQQQQYRISYTTNTRGGWEGNPFIGFSEARDVGFRYVEVFGASFCARPAGFGRRTNAGRAPSEPQKVWPDGYTYVPPKTQPPHEVYYPNDCEALQHRIYEIGVQFTAVTGGAAGESTAFEDPAQRDGVVINHFNMARFSRRFGCDHQKTNTGTRRPEGTSQEDLKNIALTLEQLGKRIKEELGMPFGVHAHLGSQIQNQNEIDFVMENTHPDHVYFVLDTGHITMAGMDPIALAKKLGNRVVEYHLKDTAPEDRGGTKHVPPRTRNMMNDPYFYPLGSGGVDFPALIAYLASTGWRGHLTVELDASPWRPAKASAQITYNYIRDTLKLPF